MNKSTLSLLALTAAVLCALTAIRTHAAGMGARAMDGVHESTTTGGAPWCEVDSRIGSR